jgi:hypothetical protein
MSYPAGETLLLAQLRSATGFAADNTDRGSWMLLNSGNSDHYAIIKPGVTKEDANNMCWVHTADVQVWQWYTDDGTSATNLETWVQNIKSRLTLYRLLGDTTGAIMDSRVTGTEPIQERWKKDGGLVWLSQTINVEWKEQEIVTYAE